MDKEQEKWAIFWCDLLSPVIYGDIEAELTNKFFKAMANEQILFPDGRFTNPSLSTLRRKFNRYQQGGFDALALKGRSDRRKSRNKSVRTECTNNTTVWLICIRFWMLPGNAHHFYVS